MAPEKNGRQPLSWVLGILVLVALSFAGYFAYEDHIQIGLIEGRETKDEAASHREDDNKRFSEVKENLTGRIVSLENRVTINDGLIREGVSKLALVDSRTLAADARTTTQLAAILSQVEEIRRLVLQLNRDADRLRGLPVP